MRVIKPLRLSLLQRCLKDGDTDHFIVSILNGFALAGERGALLPENELWSRLAEALGKDVPLDDAMPKSGAEFLVHGSFHAPGGEPIAAGNVEVNVGPLRKQLAVFGDRYWKSAGGVHFGVTDPEPIRTMPIDFAHAFGGPQFETNPLGKGIELVEVNGEPRRPLPNVEHPGRLVGSPDDRPAPAGFSAIDPMWPQRLSRAGTYDQQWQRTRFPGLAEDTDWRFFNVAQEDQWLDDYFAGDEAFEILNMHPERAAIRGNLPGLRSRCFVNQVVAEETHFREIETRLDSVILFPGADLGITIWRGTLAVATDDATDIEQLMLAYEPLAGAGRDLEHYRRALAARLDPERGYLLLLDERDLIPPGDRSGLAEVMQADQVPSEGLLIANQVAGAQEKHDAIAADLAAKGLDPAAMLPPRPAVPESPATDTIDLEKLVKDAQDKQAQAQRQVDERLQALAEQTGETVEDLRKRMEQEDAVLPRFDARRQIEQLAAFGKVDPKLAEQLHQAEKGFRDGYRRIAHAAAKVLPRARRDHARSLAAHVLAEHGAGRSLAGQDLAGVELRGADLREVDFSDAFLEFADFSEADLSGANFGGAVLAKARFRDSRLDGASFAAGNVGQSDFTGAVLNQVDFSQTVLGGACFERADLGGARLPDAQALKVSFAGAVLRDAAAPRASFVECDFSGAVMDGANLANTVFLESRLADTRFVGASLAEAVFIQADFGKASFRDAAMANVRLLKDCRAIGGDFENADISRANLRGADLRGANFRHAGLDQADLSECDLRQADFYRARARQAKFMQTNLEGAYMVAVNLMEGMLDKARLVNTDLSGSNLYGAELMGVTVGNTKFELANLKMTKLRDWAP